MWTLRLFLMGLCVFAAVAPVCAAQGGDVVYVSQSGDNTAGDSWATALWSIHDAVATAQGTGAAVWVAEGTYPIGSAVTLPSGTRVYGGFPDGGGIAFEGRDPDAYVCTLDGQNAASHVFGINGVSGVRVEGLRIIRTTGVGSGYSASGGIRINGGASDVVIQDCLFERNYTSNFGGAMNIYQAEATVRDCVFRYNRARAAGGLKMHQGTITMSGCLFEGNVAYDGPGGFGAYSSTITIADCVFRRNVATKGGGFSCHEGGKTTLTNCLFEDNFAELHAGGARFDRQRPVDLINCTFAGNSTAGSGGALWLNRGNGEFDIINCIFEDNDFTAIADVDNPTPANIRNCLFYRNLDGVYTRDSEAPLDKALDLNTYLDNGNANLTGDPLFVNPFVGNYHLTVSSPCVGAGTSVGAPTVDIDGESRVGGIDIGFDQYVDSDGDETPDWWESAHELSSSVDNSTVDTDGDQLADLDEYVSGTNPNVGDTDGDGASDAVEVARGTNPTNALRPPVYVSSLGDNTTGDSWETALWSLHDAVAAAAGGEKDVWVAEGDYKLGSAVNLPGGFAIYGGFAASGEPAFGDRDPASHETTINGMGGAAHIFTCNAALDVVIDGFTMTGVSGAEGAAVVAENAGGVRIRECLFKDIPSTGSGGGVYLHSSDARIGRCTFLDSTAEFGGGALVRYGTVWFEDCLFSGNHAADAGGAVSGYDASVRLSRVAITGNAADYGAGAVDVFGGGSVAMEDCIVAENSSGHHGGAMSLGSIRLQAVNATVANNSAPHGGGIFMESVSGTIANSILALNTSHAIYENNSNADPLVRNCLFHENPDGVYMNEGVASIALANAPDGLNSVLSEASGNMDGDPRFVPGGFHIMSGSAAIDLAEAFGTTSFDYDGEPRPYGSPDIGMDEYLDSDEDDLPDYWETEYGLDPLTANDTSVDTDGDGLDLAGEYGAGASPGSGDTDGDGMDDGWEAENGLAPWLDDADEDADQDGVTNLGEYTYGTDPQDPNSLPADSDLDVSPASLVLSVDAPSSTLTVSNLGDLPLLWQALSDTASVVLSETVGTGETAITVTASDFSAPLTATITVSNREQPTDTVSILIQVEQAPSDLDVSTNQTTLTSSSPSVQVNVINLGAAALNWSALSDTASVTVVPASAVGAGILTITATDFTADITATVTVTNTDHAGDEETIVVHVAHTPLPSDLAVSTNTVNLNSVATSVEVNVLNEGERTLNWFAESDTDSVMVSPTSGAGAGALTIAATDFATDLNAVVTVTNADQPSDTETIVVQVLAGAPGDIRLSASTLTVSESSPSATFNVIVGGDVATAWTATSDTDSVAVSPSAGTGAGAVAVTATDFTQDRTATVTVSNDNDASDQETLVVQVSYTPTPADLSVSTSAVTLTEASPMASVNVLNLGDTPVGWSAVSDTASVLVSPANGTGELALTITATAFETDLTARVTITNVNDASDTEVIVVSVLSGGKGGSGCAAGVGRRGGGDWLVCLVAVAVVLMTAKRRDTRKP